MCNGNLPVLNATIDAAKELGLQVKFVFMHIPLEQRVKQQIARHESEVKEKEMKGGCLWKNLANSKRHEEEFLDNISEYIKLKFAYELKADEEFKNKLVKANYYFVKRNEKNYFIFISYRNESFEKQIYDKICGMKFFVFLILPV